MTLLQSYFLFFSIYFYRFKRSIGENPDQTNISVLPEDYEYSDYYDGDYLYDENARIVNG